MQGLASERMSWVQVALLLLLGTNYSIVSMNHALPTFHGYIPPFHCKAGNATNCAVSNSSSTDSNPCPEGYHFNSTAGEHTFVSEWQLVCDRRLLLPLVATLYFCGVTVGAILCGMLGDRFGRRPIMLTCLFAQALLGLVIYFMNSLVAFMAVRTIQGFFVQGLQGSTYTLLMELFPPRMRTAVGVILELYWALGLAALAGIAYAVPDWRLLQLTLAAPAAVTLLYVCAIPESPRWLSARGHHEKALNVCSKLSPNAVATPSQLHKETQQEENVSNLPVLVGETRCNDDTLTINDLELQKTEDKQQNGDVLEPSTENGKEETKSENGLSTDGLVPEGKEVNIQRRAVKEENGMEEAPTKIEAVFINGRAVTLTPKKDKPNSLELLTRRVIRKHSFVMTYIWFSVSLSYYGILFYLPALYGERHLNFLIGAVLEVPAYLIGFALLSRYGRRIPLCGYLLFSGIICAAVGGISEVPDGTTSWIAGVRTALTLLGKMGVVSAFCSIFLYTSELFPTVLRAAAMGLCGFWGRIGSLIAPQLLLLSEYTTNAVPLVCMGVLCLAAGVFTLALPETLGQTLPDTIEQVQILSDKKKVQKQQP